MELFQLNRLYIVESLNDTLHTGDILYCILENNLWPSLSLEENNILEGSMRKHYVFNPQTSNTL